MARLNADIHPGLSEMVIENLRRKNVITIMDFVTANPILLVNFSGLTYKDILKIKQYILKKFSGTVRNAADLLAIERSYLISTNITCLDELLKGGLCSGQLYELCGLSSSGKTQLCLTIAANAIIQSDIVTWYFDSKRDFSSLRYEEILKARNLKQKDIENAMQRTKVCHVHSSGELIRALLQLRIVCRNGENDESSQKKKSLLVIIDSLPAVIFKITRDTHQVDHETIYELDDFAEACRFLTTEYRATMITVNSITQWNSPEQTDLAAVKPALGKYWMRIPATRLLLTRQLGKSRRISVWKDLGLDENSSCIVTVNDAGITSQ